MKKKKNILKRNSGFLVACVLAAGASYFTADAVMTKGLPASLTIQTETDTDQEGTAETSAPETIAPETSGDRVFETDPFTVTASGNIIKGVESETKQEPDTEIGETDENDQPIENTDGDNSEDDSYSDDNYYDDGSYYDDGGYYGPTIEIQDPGNGSYSYDDGSSTGGGSSDGSNSNDSAWTPSDVIIQGISSRYIDESELYNYNLGQLRLIRNEIFALHGRIFTSQDLRDYFSQKSWYVPTYSPEDFDANMFYYLNDYEEANLQVILNYEAALAGY